MVKAVLFDLDGTLWDRDGSVRRLVAAQHDAFPELADVPRDRYVDRFMELDAHGIGDKDDVYHGLVSEFDLPRPCSRALRDHFWRMYSSVQQPFPEVVATLDSLAAQGLKLGIITNGKTAIQESKIRELGLASRMDTILISEREGVRKPDSEIFQRALHRLALAATQTWFVGDHPDADVRGAKEAGLTAVWRRSWGDAPHADHVISSLDELLPLIVTEHPGAER